MQVMHFGAGNIGRGFVGDLLSKSDYKIIFVDVVDSIVNSINKHNQYSVVTVGNEINKRVVKSVIAINIKDIESLKDEILDTDLITTSVGMSNLKSIGYTLKDLLNYKMKKNNSKLDIIACENALFASNILKDTLLENTDEEFKKYIEENVGFPNCTVDRIVPNIDIKKELDIDVGVESFCEWDIEKDKVKVNNSIKDANYVDNLGLYLERKLFLLNGAHAAIAYLGYLKSYKYIHEAIRDEYIRKIVFGYQDEVILALKNKYNINFIDLENLDAYSKKTVLRFKNPYLKDEVIRVGRDPIRKLSYNDRLISPLKLCNEYKIEPNNICIILAAGYLFDYSKDKEAQEIQKYIIKFGLRKAIFKFSNLEGEKYLVERIEERYIELKNIGLK